VLSLEKHSGRRREGADRLRLRSRAGGYEQEAYSAH
ncbi:MAG: hypothetical protein ACI8X5_002059, partial [Planctomycetota bacterium]